MIFFDLDRTLFDHDQSSMAALMAMAHEMGPAVANKSIGSLAQTWQLADETWHPRYLAGEVTHVEHRRERMKMLLESFGSDAPSTPDDAAIDALFELYLNAYEATWQLYPDVVPALDALQSRPLGVITNGNDEQQRKKLSNLGIIDRFDVIVVSSAAPAPKPSPEIFTYAAEAARVDLEDCVMVGDSIASDIVGATYAGMRAIWLDRSRETVAPDAIERIASLDELPALLAA